jgi:CDP-paratose 2-epimerase
VTGSCGLIGSEVSIFFARQGFQVFGIDSNHRAVFFGPEGDTSWVLERLRREIPGYRHQALDIRDREGVLALLKELRPNLIIHTAAQPSHDKAAAIPFLDFEVNALGTLHLLEAARQFCPESPFIHMSTNKVYGDRPNTIPLRELETRWDYADPAFENGIPEEFSIDQSKHSLFGASKVAGDVMVQEYGRYFNMPTCCLRGGCLTGPNHSGVELHGFLSYLIKCNLEGREYKVYGYKGKQVRDNIHSEDVARFMFEFWQAPRVAEVYNLGGGKEQRLLHSGGLPNGRRCHRKPMKWRYVDENRIGDHICYYSDLTKMQASIIRTGALVSRCQLSFRKSLAVGWSGCRKRRPYENPDHRDLRLRRQRHRGSLLERREGLPSRVSTTSTARVRKSTACGCANGE